MPLNIAIVGCGMIGTKRAQSLAGARLAICCDVERECAQALAAAHPGADRAFARSARAGDRFAINRDFSPWRALAELAAAPVQ